jgi:hypothetical protein
VNDTESTGSNLRVRDILCRFVYQGGIKGEWVELSDALELWIMPDHSLVVDRVEFAPKIRPPRKSRDPGPVGGPGIT